MAWTDAHRSPQAKAAREAQLAAMREKYRRKPPRTVQRRMRSQGVSSERRAVKARSLTPAMMARAIRIAAKDFKGRPSHNPLFVEALEIAATYFDAL